MIETPSILVGLFPTRQSLLQKVTDSKRRFQRWQGIAHSEKILFLFLGQYELGFWKQTENSPMLCKETLPSKFFSFRKAQVQNHESRVYVFDICSLFYMITGQCEISRNSLGILFLALVLTEAVWEEWRITHRWPYLANQDPLPPKDLSVSFILIEWWHRTDVIPKLKWHCFHNRISLHHT